jgi:cytochrome c biogenesis factor
MLADKLVTEAELLVAEGSQAATLTPARHFHRLTGVWTTEVAIRATFWSDLYVILHGTDSRGRVRLTLIENPMVSWIWIGGGVMGAGACIRLWPRRRGSRARGEALEKPSPTQFEDITPSPAKRAAA